MLRTIIVLFLLFIPLDINECLTDICNVNADCTNTPGSFECTCRTGFEGSGTFCRGICGSI